MLPPVLWRAQELGHRVFTKGRLNLNIVGIRSPGRSVDEYDDLMTLTYRERTDGPLVTRQWPITTDPGLRALLQVKNPNGVAILRPGQWRVYKLDRHNGKYAAVCQRRGRVEVWRDKNKNHVLDASGKVWTDAKGINIHACDSNPFDEWDKHRDKVGPWSEGCQVFQDSRHYREYMSLVEESCVLYGPNVTYTLLDAW